MKIVHLSTSDARGGAAGSLSRLHSKLVEEGVDSHMFVLERSTQDPTVQGHRPSTRLIPRLRRELRAHLIDRERDRYRSTRPPGLEPFSDDRTPYRLWDLFSLEPDLLALHWVAGFVDLRHFFEDVAGGIPVVWRPSDLNLLTGGCHFDRGCGKWVGGCGACPQLGSSDPADLSAAVWRRKHETFGSLPRERLHLVAQSEWIGRQMAESPLVGRFDSTVLPNGVDPTTFAPRPAAALKEALGIPEGNRVVLFVSAWVANERKGIGLLKEALRSLTFEGGATLVSVGASAVDMGDDIHHVRLGWFQSEILLSVVYSMADVFVIPSLQDNFPNTVLESMACGTPVIGFEAGGIPEMVVHGETGLLAPVGDVEALAGALDALLADPDLRREMGTAGRDRVLERFTLDQQATGWTELCRRLVGSPAAGR